MAGMAEEQGVGWEVEDGIPGGLGAPLSTEDSLS